MDKILIVDDEPILLKGLKFSLEQEGYVVDTASDGEEAVEKVLANKFDLIVLDVMLRVAAIIGCDIHPLHNVSVLNRLRQAGQDEGQVNQWIGHWISQGLAAVERLIGDHGFCFGDTPGLADVYLIPQLYAAERFNIDLDSFPRILRVAALAAAHPAFAKAHPAQQPDSPAQ